MFDGVKENSSNFFKAKLDRPTWVEIDTEAVRSNIRSLRRALSSTVRFLAVVKAEAYGHGAIGVAHAAMKEDVYGFGVATPYEGQLLRESKIDAPIIVLSPILSHQADDIVSNRLTPAVASLEVAEALKGSGTKIHVKVNTGMNRSGIEIEDTAEFLRKLSKIEGIEVEGIFSHFAGSDEIDRHGAYDQFERFEILLHNLESLGLRPPIAHISNSAAIIDMPEMSLDLVRAGLAIYGMYPSNYVSRSPVLKPALTWKTHVIDKRILPEGSAVSYGGTWRAEKETTVALLPVGYADGYRRALSNKGEVLLRGNRCKIAGRVCMDLTVVDCGNNPVEIGDEVVLLGEQNSSHITADEMAEWLGTNNYEVTTQITYRVPRRIRVNE
ncbi:MAG: alanine racemase [Candidatus Hydrogenedentes bacterium CG07_land_8_20_14_0_80_42_17]|nr:MAG: alanine racemase [Candidatus Hydrogenedentes bacterium CG07_land_8_20_14_0_80_42_17]